MDYSPPEITDSKSKLIYQWPVMELRIIADRISDEGHAELWFYHDNGHGSSLLHTAKVNLMSSSTMTQLAKRMAQHSNDIPWTQVLTAITSKTMERQRQGEPIEELWTGIEEIKPPKYLLNPFIVENYPNVIFADPSAYKSNLAIIFMQILQLPWYDNPLKLDAPDKPVKCLYLDWEQDRNTVIWLAEVLSRSYDLGTLPIKYLQCKGTPLINKVEYIKEYVAKEGIEMLIIDSIGLASGPKLNDPDAPVNLYAALSSIGVTSLLLAHNSKDRETKSRTIYGNQFFQAQARNIWEIRKTQEPGSKEMDIALFHRKPPPFHSLEHPRGFKVKYSYSNKYGHDLMEILPCDPKNVAEFVEQMGNKTRILELLRLGALTQKEMTEKLGISFQAVYSALKSLQNPKSPQVVELDNKKWGLLSNLDNQ